MKDSHLESHERLEHIGKAISSIEKFVGSTDLKLFLKNEMLQDAVLLQFIIIGEAIIHVESDILDKYNYPWYKVRSFRNMIAHEYFNIKMRAVWEIIQKDLPEIKTVVKNILKKEFKS
ncbi:HepT-like ribonuclease domain-containing protein [Aurantibacillus circumpalustris]|uniref:HepT-like ribonuclease domain-containing protein n=1 Tax=Aurantibacillus circumpalustris TaxID=3036359 RepID=UPI00295BF6F1|nr:HepT-like ribonuclease domain-containing protein [Aurantibacillus circumpalustris]